MAQEIFWKSSFLKLLVSRDLDPDPGWPWKWYRREWLIDPNKYHYLVCGCIEFDCGRTYGRTYLRTYGLTYGRTFLPGLLGHLWGDDLKMGRPMPFSKQVYQLMPMDRATVPHAQSTIAGSTSSVSMLKTLGIQGRRLVFGCLRRRARWVYRIL